ncbi:MAG: hypothetical protein FJ038_06485 [Chloroflexi bacterium]|nr:hypothetical protein [Chloroflexota bacterium]
MDPAWPIRLLALDIDGTLVAGPEDPVVPFRTTAAVHLAIARGVLVALVTGRMAASARPLVDALDVAAPLIAHHGAVIRPRHGRLLFHAKLPPEAAGDVLTWAAAHGLRAHLNHLDRLIMRTDDSRAPFYGRLLGVRPRLVPDLRAVARRPVTKVMVGGEPLAPELLAEARDAFTGRAMVTTSNSRFIEFLHPRVSKGNAVAWLARRSGIPLGQVAAIGDNWSDLEMLAAVGHPIAMPHAPDAVRAAARRIAPPLADEGAAQVIEDLVLGAASAHGSAEPEDARTVALSAR